MAKNGNKTVTLEYSWQGIAEKYYNNLDAADRKYDRKDLENAKSEFYLLKGWDAATGIPSKKKLKSLGLKEISDELENRGILPTS